MDSSFVNTPEKAWASIQSLLTSAEKDISTKTPIPVYLYVTGGMRKLSEEEQQLILREIREGATHLQSTLYLVEDQSFVLTGRLICFINLMDRRGGISLRMACCQLFGRLLVTSEEVFDEITCIGKSDT